MTTDITKISLRQTRRGSRLVEPDLLDKIGAMQQPADGVAEASET
jgi:hypothetical protein